VYLSRRSVICGGAVAAFGATFAQATEKCPGVNPATGVRPALALPEKVPHLPEARPVPAHWRQTALEIIPLFESGKRNIEDAYGNVSATDVVSLGYLQWNHNSSSIYSTLLKDGGPDFVAAAPPSIRADIDRLIKASANPSRRADALRVLESWRISGQLKPSIRSDVSRWLKSPPLRSRQDALIDNELTQALRYADAWQRDMGLSTEGDAPKRAFYTFVDLLIFNGADMAGLWVDHVKAFRTKFSSGVEMLDHISQWVDACRQFTFSGRVFAAKGDYTPDYTQLYRRKETTIAIKEWRRLALSSDARLNEDALNLIAFGYLRALRSKGTDRPNGFHGVFQLDVFNRRGMMATGIGVQNGDTAPSVLFEL
jgi:hypothetical protein